MKFGKKLAISLKKNLIVNLYTKDLKAKTINTKDAFQCFQAPVMWIGSEDKKDKTIFHFI